MTSLLRFLTSSIGTKYLIGFTGLAFFAFLITHLAANLLILINPDGYNDYSHKLLTNPALLYPAEIGLVLILAVHIFKTVTNYAKNRSARPERYDTKKRAGHTSRKTTASSTMIWSGSLILIFLILHLKTFKFGPWYTTVADPTVRDLARLVFEVFQNPAYVIFYVVCMVVVGLHLRHGISSAFQSLGVDHPRYTRWILTGGKTLALIMGALFALIPVWIYFVGSPS